jgi:hypothetical protein
MVGRQFAVWMMAVVLPAAVGCYQYVPLDTSAELPAGEHIAVDITDKGRAELGDRIGSGVLRLEGTLAQSDSQNMVLNVWRVAQLGGTTSRWSGESVRFRRDYVSEVQARTLNRGRTYVVAGAVTVGLVLFLKSTNLFGSFIGGADPPEDPPPSSSRGWPF